MKDDERNIDFDLLISKKILGEASANELAILEAWLSENPENQKVHEEYCKVLNFVDTHEAKFDINLDAEWDMLSERLDFEVQDPVKTTGKVKNLSNLWFRAAAIIVVLLATSIGVLLLTSNNNNQQLAASGQVIEKTLSDGSVVCLNSNSVLTFPENFADDKRSLELEGECFFNVARDESRPFIISSGEVDVEVLGTSFNICNKKENNIISIVVETGKVSVSSKNESVIITPGQMAIYDKSTKEITIQENQDPNYLAWKTKQLLFENADLEYIVSTIEKAYNCSIVIDNKIIETCRFTMSFNNEDLESILNVIRETTAFEIRSSEENVIHIDGTGC